MLMPSIFGENLFDDFFNDFPFYDYDKEMKNPKKKNKKEKPELT